MTTGDAGPQVLGGAAAVTITPPLGSLLAGLFKPRVSATVESDLYARAIVLRSGEASVALVVCDVVSLAQDVVDTARRRIADRTGVAPGNVMVSATHTHSGPYISDRVGAARDEAYVDWLATRIAESVAVAESRLAPVTVAVGSTTVNGMCYNRRYHMADGTVRTNPGQGNPDALGPAGPVDPTVTAMLVESLDGTPVALWANLSLHYVGTDNPEQMSPDYYGHFAQTVADWLGPDVVAMMSNSASGDIITRDLAPQVPIRGIRRGKMAAATAAGAAISATMMARRRSSLTIGVRSVPVAVRRYEVTDADVALAEEILNCSAGQEPPAPKFSFVVGSPIYPVAVTSYAHGVLSLRAMPEKRDGELLLVAIGDLALVGMPGEIFVEFGLEIKERSPFALTTVVGLCGGSMGYIPTRKAFSEGGYETWRSASSWTAHGTGEAMVERVCAELPQLAKEG